MKYVIVNSYGIEVPRIGTSLEDHANLVGDQKKVISAGFFKIKNGQVECYGNSMHFNKLSRPDIDSEILTSFLFKKE